MDSLEFEQSGVKFKITGTRIDESGTAWVNVKNTANGKQSEIEHQRLCRIIGGIS